MVTNLEKVDQAPGTKRVVRWDRCGACQSCDMFCETDLKKSQLFETALIILAAKRSQYFLNVWHWY
jgi:hypothetical protein